MTKTKGGINIFVIIFKSLMLYIKNFLPLTRVMMFPVLGQIIGLTLVFYPTFMYVQNFMAKLTAGNLQQNLLLILLGLFLIIIPGFAIFIKAFWDYMIAMVSLNAMAADIIKKGNLGDFKVYNSAAKMRTNDYIILLLLLTLLWIFITVFPFFAFTVGLFVNSSLVVPIFLLMVLISVVFAIILSVRLCLAFQIFAFETISPVEVLKKSWKLMNGNFWRTIFMGIVLIIVTGLIIPALICSIIEKSFLVNYLVPPFQSYVNIFAKNQGFITLLAKANMTPFSLALTTALTTVGAAITAIMLPWGSASFTMLYFDILDRKR